MLWSAPSDPRSEASSIRLSYSGPDTQDEMKAMEKTKKDTVSAISDTGNTFSGGSGGSGGSAWTTKQSAEFWWFGVMTLWHCGIRHLLCISDAHVFLLYLLLIVGLVLGCSRYLLNPRCSRCVKEFESWLGMASQVVPSEVWWSSAGTLQVGTNTKFYVGNLTDSTDLTRDITTSRHPVTNLGRSRAQPRWRLKVATQPSKPWWISAVSFQTLGALGDASSDCIYIVHIVQCDRGIVRCRRLGQTEIL